MEQKEHVKTIKELGYFESQLLQQFSDEEIEELRSRCEQYDELYNLYSNNASFKSYVDKCCVSYGMKPEFALLEKTIQEVGYYYFDHAIKQKEQLTHCSCEDITEDKSC